MIKSDQDNCDINTGRLCLRKFTLGYLDKYAALMGDYRVGRCFPKGEGYNKEESEKSLINILEHWARHGFGIWAVFRKEDNYFLGRCGLNNIAETSEIEVDFVIVPEYWGNGYATEAAKAALLYGFKVLELEKIVALAKPENIASKKVMVKNGMHYERTAEYWGIICDIFEITAKEFWQTQTET